MSFRNAAALFLASTIVGSAQQANEKIEFFEACLPPLPLGDYSVKIEQALKEVRVDKPFTTSLEFSVAGPRFALNPADVYAVYPPANQTGDFGNTFSAFCYNDELHDQNHQKHHCADN